MSRSNSLGPSLLNLQLIGRVLRLCIIGVVGGHSIAFRGTLEPAVYVILAAD